MHNTADEEINTSMLARQAVRAFATAPDLFTGHQRVKVILDEYTKLEASANSLNTWNSTSSSREIGGKFTYNIKCFAEKCLTPGSLIELELYRKIESIDGLEESKNRKASAVARTYVDKWRDAP
ncbi:MAG: hypothetical protein FGM47_03340 [Candidatus Nanopelagicaceae bacterium]|nr:hypothetical protein [Candidatus Nanopelagicaceae bacterium]